MKLEGRKFLHIAFEDPNEMHLLGKGLFYMQDLGIVGRGLLLDYLIAQAAGDLTHNRIETADFDLAKYEKENHVERGVGLAKDPKKNPSSPDPKTHPETPPSPPTPLTAEQKEANKKELRETIETGKKSLKEKEKERANATGAKQQKLDAEIEKIKAEIKANEGELANNDIEGCSIHYWLWPTLAGVCVVGTIVVCFVLKSEEDDDDDDDSDDDSSDDDKAGSP
jgi:type IV secretory pathway VirB10-like protein